MTRKKMSVHSYYWDDDHNVCHGAQIMEPSEIVATLEALTTQRDAMRKTLRKMPCYGIYTQECFSDSLCPRCAALALVDGAK